MLQTDRRTTDRRTDDI